MQDAYSHRHECTEVVFAQEATLPSDVWRTCNPHPQYWGNHEEIENKSNRYILGNVHSVDLEF